MIQKDLMKKSDVKYAEIQCIQAEDVMAIVHMMKKLYEKIMQILDRRIKQLPSAQQAESED